jgi:hypothetical protein
MEIFYAVRIIEAYVYSTTLYFPCIVGGFP